MTEVALLAPVPLEHLESGTGICEREGKVAFGSRAWEVFRELDTLRHGKPIPALIYASEPASHDGPPVVAWRAQYIGHAEGKNGAHPAGMRFRPPTTGAYESDNKGWWAVFWEVADLARVSKSEEILIKELQSRSGAYYKPEFIPEGPIIIAAP
ncbi:MAG: hypothetical protein ACRES9_01865 [Gammaproteobacteria bacterium]